MAKLPNVLDFGPRPTPQPSGGIASYRPVSGAEAAPGEALARVGSQFQHTADHLSYIAKVEEEKANTLDRESRLNKVHEVAQDLRAGPDGFLNIKGGDAVNRPLFQDYTAKLDAAAKQITEGMTPQQRQQFDIYYNKTIKAPYQNDILNHRAHQGDVYQEQTRAGTIGVELKNIGMQYANPNAVGASIARMFAAEEDSLRRKGLADAPGALETAQQKILDQALTARFEAYVYANPVDGLRVFRENAEKMSSHARLQMEARLKDAADGIEAKTVAERAMASDPNQQPGGMRLPLYEAVEQQESGGKQSVVSPKGAIGVMQVMPATARYVANRLGIPFDEQKLRTDAAYNRQIGQAYLQEQLQRYSGNQTLALAAYNAGPERVDEWIKRFGDPNSGSISNDEWTKRIPFAETRDYVSRINAKAPIGTPTATRDTRAMLGTWIANAEREAERARPGDIVFRDKAISQVKANVATISAQQEGVQRQAQGQLIDLATGLRGGSKPLTESELLSTPEGRRAWELADPQARLGIGGILERNRREIEYGAPIRSDPTRVNELFRAIHLPDGDPQKISQVTQLTPFFANGLNRTDFDWLRKELDANQSIGGRNFTTDVQRVRQSAHTMLLRSPLGSVQGEIAEEASYRFSFDLNQKIEEYRKANKDPRSLLTPGSPDYVLKPENVLSYMQTPAQAIQAQANAIRTQQTTAAAAAPAGAPRGLLELGNIDLTNRPVVKNADGSISTVRSMSFNENGREVLVPTVSSDGKILKDNEAIALYRQTGKHLGKFDSPDNATTYAKALSSAQGRAYQQPVAMPAALPRVSNEAEYNALPAGALYIDPNGVQRTKR